MLADKRDTRKQGLSSLSEANLMAMLETFLPKTFSRSQIDELFNGIIKSKTQANYDYRGEGPPSFKNGRNVFYERDSYLKWLGRRILKIKSCE